MYRKHLTGNTLRVSCIQGQGTQGKGMGTEDFLDNEKRVLPWVPGAALGGAVGLTGARGREKADKPRETPDSEEKVWLLLPSV